MDNKTLRCACLLMQRNESELLEPWIKYHGALFGYENLFIFDNGSDNPKVKRILEHYITIGVHVDNQFPRPEDYLDKGKILTDCAQRINETGGYDFFFPLDCDEFLAFHTEDGKVSCNFDKIKDYLTYLPKSDTTYHVIRNYLNIIGSPDYFQEHPGNKVFFSNQLIVPLDHDLHLTSSSAETAPCEIVYIHCHARPFDTMLVRSRDKLRPWVDVDDPKALVTFEADKGIGWNLVKYLRMSEKQYLDTFNKTGATHIPELTEILKNLGCFTDFLTGSHTGNTDIRMDKLSIPNVLHLNAIDHTDDNTIILAMPRLSEKTSSVMATLLSAMNFEIISAGSQIGEDHTVRSALQAGLWEKLRKFSIAQAEKNRRLAITDFSADELSLLQSIPVANLRSLIVLPYLMTSLTGSHEIVASSARPLLARQARENAETLTVALSSTLEALLVEETLVQNDPQALLVAFLDFLGPEFKAGLDADALVQKIQYDSLPCKEEEFSFYEGWIDTVSDDLVAGWCWRKYSDIPQVVGLIIDDQLVEVAIANTYREDLRNAGIGCGSFGFHLPLPENGPFSPDRIQVRILKDNVRLRSSSDPQH